MTSFLPTKSPSFSAVLTAAALAFAGLVSAPAAVIYSTYNSNDSGTASGLHTGSGKAVAFEMPATLLPGGTTHYTLDSIAVRLSSSAGVTSTDVKMSLYTNDGSNTPGSLIESLSASSSFTLTSSVGTYTFLSSGSTTLSASTRYWIVMEGTNVSPDIYYWHSSDPLPSPLSSVGVTNGGAVYGSGSPSGWTSTSGVSNAVTVNATAVPEPAACLLFVVGATAVLLRRRKA